MHVCMLPSLQYRPKVWMHILIQCIFFILMTIYILTEGIKTMNGHIWNYVKHVLYSSFFKIATLLFLVALQTLVVVSMSLTSQLKLIPLHRWAFSGLPSGISYHINGIGIICCIVQTSALLDNCQNSYYGKKNQVSKEK